MNTEQTKTLQTIRNDFLAWEREGVKGTSEPYYGMLAICAGAVLMVFGMAFSGQKLALACGIIAALAGLALLFYKEKGADGRADDILLSVLAYRPVNEEAYQSLLETIAYAGKLKQPDLKNWLSAELAALEKTQTKENNRSDPDTTLTD
ncbi:Uncharacterised protein [Citrobacter amalonaticus]|uniref:hypothetical protein n=1 Tax=Citrobacter amalonaticus TaxID=35703 RepID=UPI000E1370D4|nr:hypothetical protein [Citrobacter amalonaticus]UBI23046.1 hypothetical protein LA348_22980 [Citrobacter amalonaticus]BCU50930.1 hypothetical protein CIAM_44510 [Citrobacter amalonaticus]STA63069.1 Uncharacterised protein [Citrobacter amalonaticus]